MDKIVKKAINNIIKFQITHTHTYTHKGRKRYQRREKTEDKNRK